VKSVLAQKATYDLTFRHKVRVEISKNHKGFTFTFFNITWTFEKRTVHMNDLLLSVSRVGDTVSPYQKPMTNL